MIASERILFQDDYFLAVNKLSGELSVRGKGEMDKLPLFDFLRTEHPGIHPVNRLDFETSGVMLFAKSRKVLEMMIGRRGNDQGPMTNDPSFAKATEGRQGPRTPPSLKLPARSADHSGGRRAGNDQDEVPMQKTYRLLVSAGPLRERGVIRAPIKARSGKGMAPAETTYRVIERFPIATDVEATLASGRHHQIRRHFAFLKCPLILDDVYGDKKKNAKLRRALRYRRFFLHACKLSFVHPVTQQKVEVEAPMPKSFVDVLAKMRGAM